MMNKILMSSWNTKSSTGEPMMDEPVRLCLLVCLSFSTSDDLDNDDTVTDKTKFRYLLFFFT